MADSVSRCGGLSSELKTADSSLSVSSCGGDDRELSGPTVTGKESKDTTY